jgi:hypothetical protein
MVNRSSLNKNTAVKRKLNSEKARSRMEARSTGNHGYGDQGRLIKYRGHLGCWISPCYDPFSLEGFLPFISLTLQFFFRPALNRGY